MNRAGHRRLAPWLLAASMLLAALVLAEAVGRDREVTWLPPPAKPKLAEARPGVAPADLQAYANSWEQPLFSPERQPDRPAATKVATASLQGMALTGSVLTEGLHVALFKDPTGKMLRLSEGASLPSGWTLRKLEPNEAHFVQGDQQQTLRLLPARPLAAADGSLRAASLPYPSEPSPGPLPAHAVGGASLPPPPGHP